MTELRVAVGFTAPLMALGLRSICESEPGVTCVGGAGDAASLVEGSERWRPQLVVTEPAILKPDGVIVVTALRRLGAHVLLVGVSSVLDEAAALVRAGAAGFVPLGADAPDIATAMRQAAGGGLVLEAELTRRLLAAHEKAYAPPALSPREVDVLRLVARGQSNRQIAAALFLCETTVKTHLLRVNEKLGTRRRAAAVAEALRLGLIAEATRDGVAA